MKERKRIVVAVSGLRVRRIGEVVSIAVRDHEHVARLEAFRRLGGTVREREPRRYEVTHVPAAVRNRDRQIGTGDPVLARYERIVFEKDLIAPPGQPLAAFVCPGHPLLDAVLDLSLERHRDLLKRGTVLVDGKDVAGLRPCDLNKLGVGRTFQMLQVFPEMTVLDNIILAGQEHHGTMLSRLFGKPDAGLTDEARRIIAFFRLTHQTNEKAGSLSYGQQKLLDAAMAFMAGPKLVMLDEPAGGVNLTMLANLKERLKAFNEEHGATFVVIEHNMEFVMSLCTRIIVLANGRIIAEGDPETVRNDPQVIEAYLGGVSHA